MFTSESIRMSFIYCLETQMLISLRFIFGSFHNFSFHSVIGFSTWTLSRTVYTYIFEHIFGSINATFVTSLHKYYLCLPIHQRPRLRNIFYFCIQCVILLNKKCATLRTSYEQSYHCFILYISNKARKNYFRRSGTRKKIRKDLSYF